MLKKLTSAGLGVAAVCASHTALAFAPPPDASDSQAFVGVAWNFGSNKPAFQFGIRHVSYKCNDNVRGWQVLADVDVKEGFDKVRLEGVAGRQDGKALATYGLGYSFSGKGVFGSIGAQGSHAFGRFDYTPKAQGVSGFAAGLNTLKRVKDCGVV